MLFQSNYIQHKELLGAQGCKITGKDLEKVMAGAPLFVADNHDEIEVFKVMNPKISALKSHVAISSFTLLLFFHDLSCSFEYRRIYCNRRK